MDVVHGLFHHRLSVARKGGVGGRQGGRKGWSSLFLNPVRGSNYFLCHPLLT